MLKHMKLRVPLLTKRSKKTSDVNEKEEEKKDSSKIGNAVLYVVYRSLSNSIEKQIKIHPTVTHFFTHIPQKELEFDCTELPSLVPPLPWLSTSTGGYLLNQTDFVRLPVSAGQQDARLRSLPIEKIGGLLDSINVLNSCPWKMNAQVLDLLIDIFQRGGSRMLSVPVSVDNAKLVEPLPLEKVIEEMREIR